MLSDDVKEYYGGVEPVDVGNLDDVKEQKSVIPATKDVLFRIKKAELRIIQDNTWRSINLQLQLVNGIGEEGKYKNKVLFSNVPYYADPIKYSGDYFKSKQHLLPLKFLRKATGLELNPIDGHTVEQLEKAPYIKASITIRQRKVLDENKQPLLDEQGKEVKEPENDVRFFKAVDPSELV